MVWWQGWQWQLCGVMWLWAGAGAAQQACHVMRSGWSGKQPGAEELLGLTTPCILTVLPSSLPLQPAYDRYGEQTYSRTTVPAW